MDSMQRVVRGRHHLLLDSPFWGSLALKLAIVETRDFDTMAVDGIRLFVNPDFVATLNDPELRGVLAHEVQHCCLGHFARQGDRESRRWNEATDYAINLDLLDCGFKLPQGALVDSRFRNMGAESIYAALEAEADQKQGQPKQGQAGAGQQGQGAGQAMPGIDPGMCGGVIQPGKGPKGQDSQGQPMPDVKALAADWQGAALNVAAIESKRAGTLPGSIRNMVKELRTPAISWRELLRNIVTDSTQREYSWNKPNRRFIGAGRYLPSLVSNGRNRITVAIDTSGSLPGKALEAFGGELQAMLDESLADHVTVIYCDSRVQHVAEYEAGDILKLERHGGGGTAFAPVFEHMAAHDNDSACLIYFTDLECSESRIGQAPACPVIWANWSRPRVMPFGDVIQVDPHA